LVYKLTLQGSRIETINGIVAKAYVINKFIENKYNTWVLDGSMLPTSDVLLESRDPNYDFCVAKNVELLYAKSSSSSEKI
jgi:hypothetical protein